MRISKNIWRYKLQSKIILKYNFTAHKLRFEEDYLRCFWQKIHMYVYYWIVFLVFVFLQAHWQVTCKWSSELCALSCFLFKHVISKQGWAHLYCVHHNSSRSGGLSLHYDFLLDQGYILFLHAICYSKQFFTKIFTLDHIPITLPSFSSRHTKHPYTQLHFPQLFSGELSWQSLCLNCLIHFSSLIIWHIMRC